MDRGNNIHFVLKLLWSSVWSFSEAVVCGAADPKTWIYLFLSTPLLPVRVGYIIETLLRPYVLHEKKLTLYVKLM